MMVDFKDRLNALLLAIENWLHSDNPYLERAKVKTAEEGYFNFSDIQFALNALKETVNEEALKKWIDQAELSDNQHADGKNVLCLHAGNLPLVGLQDVLAVLLSGARYTGKISRKDPYLLPTFLNEVKKTEAWDDVEVQWSHRLSDFEGMRNDVILFAGSENSVPEVMESLNRLNLNQNETRTLIRTAHFSLVYFTENSPQNLRDLTESIFRYGGNGCRSVACVVSPHSLDNIGEELAHSAQEFWEEYPQHQKPMPKLQQQFAYNEAVGHSQIWLDDFLIQEGASERPMDFTCFWVQGDKNTTAKLANKFSDKIQSIYVTDDDMEIPGYSNKTEPLSTAQKPPVYWKPDGVDTLEWLCDKESFS